MPNSLSRSQQLARRRALLLTVGNLGVVGFTLLLRPRDLSGAATFVLIAADCGLLTLFVEMSIRRARRRSAGVPPP